MPLGTALVLDESNEILDTDCSWAGEFPCIVSITTLRSMGGQ